MCQNVELKQNNSALKECSTAVLQQAIERETESREKNTLACKAKREKLFIGAQTQERTEFIRVLENRDDKQRKNVQGLIQYARKITNELEGFKDKVYSAEAVSQDLRSTGNDKIDDLGQMCKIYTRGNENKREDIGTLRKVIVQKDDEIFNLNEEIRTFEFTRQENQDRAQRTLDRGHTESKINSGIIARKDKLNTDMTQKNDLMSINIVNTQFNVKNRNADKSALSIKLNEMKGLREKMGLEFRVMRGKLNAYETE